MELWNLLDTPIYLSDKIEQNKLIKFTKTHRLDLNLKLLMKMRMWEELQDNERIDLQTS